MSDQGFTQTQKSELRSELRSEIRTELKSIFTTFRQDLARDMQDFTRSEILASEQRLKTYVHKTLTEVLTDNLFPVLDNHETRLVRLEVKPA